MSESRTVYLPDGDMDPVSLAELFIEEQGILAEISQFYYSARRHLAEVIKAGGPLVLSDGRKVDLRTTRWDYPDEIAHEYPQLADPVLTVRLSSRADQGRAIDLLAEEFPTCQIDPSWKVDGRRVRRAIDQGGAVAHRLIELRQPRSPELVVEP